MAFHGGCDKGSPRLRWLLTIHCYTSGSSTGGAQHLWDRAPGPSRQWFIPAEKFFAYARKLQGEAGCTVSVC